MKKWINEKGKVIFDISKEFDRFINNKNIRKLLFELSRTKGK